MSVGKTTLVNALKELEQSKGYETATERSKYTTEVWTFDLNKSPYGPISVDIKYKAGAEKR